MSSTLGSRVILNLRGSILCSAYSEEDTTISFNTLQFNNDRDGQNIAMRDLTKDTQDLLSKRLGSKRRSLHIYIVIQQNS